MRPPWNYPTFYGMVYMTDIGYDLKKEVNLWINF